MQISRLFLTCLTFKFLLLGSVPLQRNSFSTSFFQVGESFPVFNPSRSLLGESQQLQRRLWTTAPLPGASPQGEWEDGGETVATSPLDPTAGPTDPQVLHPASQVTPTDELKLQ